MTRDLRKYMQSTNVRLAIGGLSLLFIVGLGLIWLIYGEGAAVVGLICILAGLAPVILIFLVFRAADLFLKRSGRE